jgi:integrase
MSVFQPSYKDPKSGKTVKSGIWWFKFHFAGRLIRESANTTRKTLAKEAEKSRRLELERAIVGLPSEAPESRIRTVAECAKTYIEHYGINHRDKSAASVKERLKRVVEALGSCLLIDLNEDKIRGYMKRRIADGVSGRTINLELGTLSRSMGVKWGAAWPRVKPMEQRSDVGKALSDQEERAIIAAADLLAAGAAPVPVKRRGKTHLQSPGPRGVMMPTMIRLSLLTGMRQQELLTLTWGQVDFAERLVRVRRAKTAAGTGRTIPLPPEACDALTAHLRWWQKKFGEPKPKLYLFPSGSPMPNNPTKPLAHVKNAWAAILKEAKVEARWHDMRHSYCTRLAAAGVPETTMLSLLGHVSRQMLLHYSHIRLQSKRDAVAGLRLAPEGNSSGVVQDSVQVRGTSRPN